GRLRVPDALRGTARQAAGAGRGGGDDARLRAVRDRLVRALPAAAGRTARQRRLLPARARLPTPPGHAEETGNQQERSRRGRIEMDAISNVPEPVNEPVLGYAPGSPERAALEQRIKELSGSAIELTMTIGGERRMAGGEAVDVVQPHNH